ncbi:MAG: PAS domain-containing protein, partial [Gammaproteobacteria bacterium]
MYQFIDDLAFNLVIIELDRSAAVAAGIAPLIKQVNPSAAGFLGYGAKELIDKPLDVICAPGKYQDILTSLNEDSSCKSFEGELITHAGERVPVLISLTVLPGHNQNKTGIVLLIQDISDRKALDKIQLMMHR